MNNRVLAALIGACAGALLAPDALAQAGDPLRDPAIQRVRESFKVDGIALFDPHAEHAPRMGVCAASIFTGLKWCVSGNVEETRGAAAYVKTTGYNIDAAARIVYALSTRRGYPLKRDEFEGVIQGIGERFGAGAAVYALRRTGEGVEVDSLIAVWGGLRLVHLAEAEYATVETGGSLKRGHLVDHRFNLIASAKQRDPVYKIEGEAGFILHIVVTGADRADVIGRVVYQPAFLPAPAKPSAGPVNPLVGETARRPSSPMNGGPSTEERTRLVDAERALAAERLLREEAERKAAEESAARAEAERKLAAERRAGEELRQRLEDERKAAEERARRSGSERRAPDERRAREEAERKAAEDAARSEAERAETEAERKALEERRRKEKEEADRKSTEEAERRALEARRQTQEAERKTAEERRAAEERRGAEARRAREELARKARERAEAEAKARAEAERKAAEEAARAEAERKAAEETRRAEGERERAADAERAAEEARKSEDKRAAERKAEAERSARERAARPAEWYRVAADAAKRSGAIWSFDETQDRLAEERTLRAQTIFAAADRLAVEVTFECMAGRVKRLRASARGFDRKSGAGIAFRTEGEGAFGVRTRIRLDDRPPQDGLLFRERQDDTASIVEVPVTEADLDKKTSRASVWLRHYVASVEFHLATGTVTAAITPYADNLRGVLEACAE